MPAGTGADQYRALSHQPAEKGRDNTGCCRNRSANTLLVVSDPDRHYLGEVIDLDRAVALITEKKRDFDQCFVFIHNDAGVSYAATMGAISRAKLYALVYGEHFDEQVKKIEFPCTIIAAKAVHNPLPLKKAIDEVAPWAA